MICRSRERVARTLAHREADRVPFDAIGSGHEPVRALLSRMDLSPEEQRYYREGEFAYVTFRIEPDRARYAPYLPGLPADGELSEWGVGRIAAKSVDGYHAGYRLYHPLASVNTVEELERYPFPDVTDPKCHAHLAEQVARLRDDEFTVVGQMSQTILETAYEMRGMERLFTDFFERPDYVRALFERIAERRCFQARKLAEAGVDVLRIGDDIATQAGLLVGPAMYRDWIKPFHARVVAAARAVNPETPVLYHSDGTLTALLPDLIEAGVTAINPVQAECMPLAQVKAAFGDRLVLWGCCSTQSVYAHGTEEDVAAELQSLMRDVAPGGGLVVQFYNMLVTDRVLRNLEHFFRTFRREAGYR
jgi:uroporphyrinogen decarboxylase